MTLIAQGLTNAEIAECMYVSPNTVKTHVRIGCQTLGRSTRAQAAVWAIENDLHPRLGPDSAVGSS
jgi:DNA-binding NarL/FixJ family response regulator